MIEWCHSKWYIVWFGINIHLQFALTKHVGESLLSCRGFPDRETIICYTIETAISRDPSIHMQERTPNVLKLRGS